MQTVNGPVLLQLINGLLTMTETSTRCLGRIRYNEMQQ